MKTLHKVVLMLAMLAQAPRLTAGQPLRALYEAVLPPEARPKLVRYVEIAVAPAKRCIIGYDAT